MEFRVLFRLLVFGMIFVTHQCTSDENFLEGTFSKTEGTVLKNHVIAMYSAKDSLACAFKCASADGCQSFNYKVVDDKGVCEISRRNKNNAFEDYREDDEVSYFGKEPCIPNPCSFDGTCLTVYNASDSSNMYSCQCRPEYKGMNCDTAKLGWMISRPAKSCKEISDNGDAGPDGLYYIDPEDSGNPFKAYCDMMVLGGGWLLIVNFTVNTDSRPLTITNIFREIANCSNGYTGISRSALGTAQDLISFTQIRFICYKSNRGRKIHIVTKPDANGKAVVDYFTGKTNTRPASCNSFEPASDDNSFLASQCSMWDHSRGLWGHKNRVNQNMMYDHTFFVAHTYHWRFLSPPELCDDDNDANSSPVSGDFWHVFIR